MNGPRSFIGVDAGASHTRLIGLNLVADDLAWLQAPGASMDLYGADGAAAMLAPLVRQLNTPAPAEVVAAVAGADSPAEQKELAAALTRQLDGWRVQVINDAHAALIAQLPTGPGAVLVAGTGTNAMARRTDGQLFGLRAKGYLQGNYGGGLDLSRRAVHLAFRAEEGSGDPSRLEQEVLALSGLASYDQLSEALGRNRASLWPLVQRLPPLVMRLAAEGDHVCQNLLAEIGQALAGSVRAAVVQAEIAELPGLPVVLAGGLLGARSPHLEGPLAKALELSLRHPQLTHLSREPARGALFMAVAGHPELGPRVWTAPLRVLGAGASG
ncbi:MAG: N-acetylglucosamine kinase [Sulfobacillus sp.]